MMIQDFEKFGVFYLGKIYDSDKGKLSNELLLYDSKNLTTHAMCVGMTGSGKTGLGIALLEEAAIDRIPSLVIDPKGDLGDLLLTFPELSPSEFLPWVDPAEAERQKMTVEAYAEMTAKNWKEGLAKWGEGPERIQKLKAAVEMTIYTPASRAGVPLSILSSFAAPPKEMLLDLGALRERVLSTTSSLLGLLGIAADPIKSREHILIATIIDQAWREGSDLDLVTLIQRIQKPPFDKMGALDINTFFPAKDRMALSISLNGLLASPGFQAWMEGDPLDIQQLLYTPEGKPKLSIISIAHLSDSERMFFVTLLLNQLLAWMRRQSGTSSLRALFYMDEIFGFFPPTSMPPSKVPMLTLLKQARAYGLGIVLATQNPVDLDYKGLSNCGTWFIGKLQTERDRARVIEGLNVASNGEIDSKALDKFLAATGKRIFIMRSIHEKEPLLFETRWTMSYLRGPLTLTQIESLTDKRSIPTHTLTQGLQQKSNLTAAKVAVPPGISEYFVRRPNMLPPVRYRPLVIGFAKLHFVDAKSKVDTWEDFTIVASPGEGGNEILWEKGENVPEIKKLLEKEPLAGSTYEEMPSGLMQEKNYVSFAKSFAAWLYQNQTLSIYQYADLGLFSEKGESEKDFRLRIALGLREKRDQLAANLRNQYSKRMTVLTEKIRRAQEKLSQKKQQAGLQKADTWISIGTTLLGTLFGKGPTKGTLSQAGTSMRRVGKMSKETQEASQAEEECKALQRQFDEVQAELNQKISQIPSSMDPSNIKLETLALKPRKSDISVEGVALIWWPINPSQG